jgi:RNA polymerase-interacting CarD/CdnL/TRCF family regulator
MKILISLILSLIFIIPVSAQEKSDVGPNYSEEQIQELLNTVQEGVECQIANNSLKADLTYYKIINSVLKAPEPAVLAKIEEKIERNRVLFESFLTGLTQALMSVERFTEEEIKQMFVEWVDFSNSKIDMRKSIGYRDGLLEQHLMETFEYLNKCRKWEKSLMGDMAPN